MTLCKPMSEKTTGGHKIWRERDNSKMEMAVAGDAAHESGHQVAPFISVILALTPIEIKIRLAS